VEYTHLGRSGLSVSRLCLGTMNFGPNTSEDDSHAIMDAALDSGINFFDTANVYGWKKGQGLTEQIIGRWFDKGGGRRDKVVIATKLYGSMSDWPNDTFLSARNIRHACEGSLRRLKTDHIDLYQMHHVDLETPWEEIWQAMEVLVSEGKVIYVGSSNFAGWTIAQAQETARARHFMGLASEQCLYNLVERHAEEEVLPAARHYGLGVIPWSPLMRGLLSGVIARSEQGVRTASQQTQSSLRKHRKQIERFEELCNEIGAPPASVGLAWLLHQPGISAPITGPRTLEQLEASLGAVDVRLSDEILKKLDAIFPGPGPSPQSFAW
jgi:NDP-hexose C3-ketoreductase / dTDP-4-oxo-2-deoxy-alpha-D-pentos-2-ene 2,3-reductase